MFAGYSRRARTCIFIARHRAGLYGADAVDVDHLILGLIYEDQGKTWETLRDLGELNPARTVDEPHERFLPADLAAAILVKLEGAIPHGPPRPPEEDMSLSATVKETLGAAYDLMRDLHQQQLEPLHLLAAALERETNEGVRMLRESGISKDKVVKALLGNG